MEATAHVGGGHCRCPDLINGHIIINKCDDALRPMLTFEPGAVLENFHQ